MALLSIAKNKDHCFLDVGCGLGGTAHYVQKQGWGRITGIDIDKNLIDYAKAHYPEIDFVCEDILQAKALVNRSFQCIYSLSAFYCFASQELALKQLSQLAASEGSLVLFDYSKQDNIPIKSPFSWSKTALQFSPILLPELKRQLSSSGWQFKESIDLSQHFICWYTSLLHQFEQKRGLIIHQFNEKAWDIHYSGYEQLLMDLNAQKIGGVVVYASRSHL
ncbi:class I SAM-dependent methyltransferase [Legionella hackeliae]|uniref:Putative methyltransferase n=1 Tax=Legionella hackeliae TaxID=449 RepID=A0A0A8UKQ4_LEGHA|nr:class I SAM-dependent methyltransferase [Legionella hackeliae]KTD13470.1 hypothetical protein Lhac_0854 [Legionella hackeliae]CEK09313.1 putative methyltransferase [Legionella hackeliae]STX49218.1 S-adenosyl-L-methionine-dependent methyltransferases [Legionella hackeliae]